MGTGGGELFADLLSDYRGRALATEEWHVNAPVAATRLRPLGVDVIRCRSAVLPFREGVFDLVLNRHEELDPGDVARVLAEHGRLLTQQVGRQQWKELREFLPRKHDFGDLFRRYQAGLMDSGMKIVQIGSHDWTVAYRGLGDVVFMLCVTPWDVPDFDPLGRDLRALLALEKALATKDGIVLTESRFLIEAMKVA